jgi:predicted secreted Zn-dependent protease
MGPVTACMRRLRACSHVASVAMFILLMAAAPASAAGLMVNASVKTHESSPAKTITSGALSTTTGNELLVAFLASDGPKGGGTQTFSSVTGAGVTWKLAQRTNTQAGTAEIWTAVAPSPLTNATVTATRGSGSFTGNIDVVAFSGADTTTAGAVGTASAASGQPSVSLTTTSPGSWVWAVGDDWDNASSRTVGAGQTKFDEFLAGSGDTFWTQSQTAPGNAAGTKVTLNDTAPTTDRWDMAAIEIRPGTPDTSVPTLPTHLTATALNSNQVRLGWSASTDNVGVTGYDVLRGGTVIGTASGTTYTDNTVSPSTQYSYTVEAFDAAGNVSNPSDPATVTTPAAAANPPVISQIATSNVTTTAATVSWTTNIPSSSQVLYGGDATYGQSTTLDSTLVTSHTQTLNGLTPGTTYHFAVQSAGSAGGPGTSGDNTFSTMANNMTLPDLQLKVPTSQIGITSDPKTGDRLLRYTHITWDAGAGPFELDPTFNATTGTATFMQAIYAMDKPGVWTLDHKVPVAATAVFDPPSDYQFPLNRFTLNTVNSDGTVGPQVAISHKTDYCMTGDAFVGGVPNAPNATTPVQSNCNNANAPLGWSVGWGDEYDHTDNGQPIDLTGVPDGTYILEGTVDPDHVITESDATNNVTDTEIQISGVNVMVLSQSNPGTVPPTVAMLSPSNGDSVSGTVPLQASAAAGGSASITSVQFLLDGQSLGAVVTAPPYTFNWTVGSTSLGDHTLSARVTDSSGNVATGTPVTVHVVAGGGGGGIDTTAPTVAIANPTVNETLSDTVPVAANATDNVAIASVQFMLDGKPLGSPVTASPYAINWDTTTAAAGTHLLTAVATDTSGNRTTSAQVSVTVQNPAPPNPCFIMDAQANVRGTGKVTTPAFHTGEAGETLLAFVSSDGPNKANGQTVTVSGAGLTWTLVKRANGQPGDSEVWQATAPAILSAATVTSTPANAGFAQDLTVIAMQGLTGVGASASASGASGAPSLQLTTQGAPSLVFAVGHDYDNAIARTLPANWTMLDQWVNTAVGDTYWTQYTSAPVITAGTVFTVSDTAPTTDRWDLAAVELIGDDS